MEVKSRGSKLGFLYGTVLKGPKPFSNKREINFAFIAKAGSALVFVTVVILLSLPNPKPEQTSFHEKLETSAQDATGSEFKQRGGGKDDPLLQSISQLQTDRYSHGGGSIGSSVGSAGGGRNLGSSMILSRAGSDSKTQLPPGTRIMVKLIQKITIGSQGMPVIGLVAQDVEHDSDLAIPRDSKLFGEVSFDQDCERAMFNWKSVILPDGRQRDFGAIGVGLDDQVGIEENVHSDRLKNIIGQTLTTFVGAYASGSMTRSQFGVSEGGAENGMKNAIAETSKNQANALGESLNKERKWIELPAGSLMSAVLNTSFTFKDPGSVH